MFRFETDPAESGDMIAIPLNIILIAVVTL